MATPTAFGARQIGTMNAAVQRWLMLTVTLTVPNPVPGAVGAAAAAGLGSRWTARDRTRFARLDGAERRELVPAMTLGFAAIGLGLLVSTLARRRQEAQDD